MTARETLRKLTPIIGEERASRLWRVYLSSDSLERRNLECTFEAYAAQALGDVPSAGAVGLFPPPPPERALGDLDLGYVRYAGKDSFLFGLRTEELLRHVGIYGSSGCGKSNGIALILDGLMNAGIPFLLCDFKRTFRGLLQDRRVQVLVFTAGDERTSPFRLNPLVPPPGTSIEVWTKKVIGALSHAFCQGAGSESLLVAALEEAYAQAASGKRWPTFEDVAQVLEAEPARGRKGMWMDSAQRAVKSISTGNAAAVFCPSYPTPLLDLLTRPAVLEMDLLNQAEQTLLAEVLLLWIIQYRMNNNTDRESLKHALVIEEAHHLLRAPPGVGDGSEPVIHIALREVRELGESVILATQNASVVPVAVFGNQATTLAFHTKHAKDVSSTAQAMLLKDEGKDELGRLPVGEAIVRVPRWQDPVHIRLKLRPIAKGKVSDQDIRQHMSKAAYFGDSGPFHAETEEGGQLRTIPPREENELILTESPSTQACSKIREHASPATTPENIQQQGVLPSQPSALEWEMLKDIVRNPFDGVVKRIKRLGVSRRKGTAALSALENRKITMPVSVFTGSAVLKLFELTQGGRSLCNSHAIGPLPKVTDGGVEHQYWVRHAASVLKSKGWRTHTEYPATTDVIVDIHAQKEERTMAVLVETGRSNVARNLTKTIIAGYAELWVVSNNPLVRKTVDGFVRRSPSAAAIRFIHPNEL